MDRLINLETKAEVALEDVGKAAAVSEVNIRGYVYYSVCWKRQIYRLRHERQARNDPGSGKPLSIASHNRSNLI